MISSAAHPVTSLKITVEFNSGVEVGAPWQLTGPMAGITPAIAWPQSENVTA